MQKKAVIFLFLSFLVVLFLIPINAHARIYLFDRKLEITGKIEEKVLLKYHMKSWEKGQGKYGYRARGGRMQNPAMLKTHFHIDGLFHLYESDDTILDIYTLWEWFYDFAPDIRGARHRTMSARDRNRYQTPHEEEFCRELYMNFVSGPWTLRLGKQMVVWGETGLKRTADVINPLDMRSHMMGVDDWEDFKKGLWMFRGFYQTDFTNDLTFEVIWVPYDIEVMDLPPEGSVYNTQYSGGFFSSMQRRWKYDQPKEHGLHTSQGGLRIRGYNWDIDWTIMWYNGFNPTPVVYDWGQRGSRSYTPTTYFGWKSYNTLPIGGFVLYAGEYNRNFAEGERLPRFPNTRQFKYYRTDNFGVTATKYLHEIRAGSLRIPTQLNMRFEGTYKEGVHFNRTDNNDNVYGITQKDVIGYALEMNRDFMPQWICRFNDQRSVDVTFAIYQDWIMGHHKRIRTGGWDRGPGDKSCTTFNVGVTTDWIKQELMTKFDYSYDTSGNGSFWAFFQYAPGNHWRFTVLPRISWSNVGYTAHKARSQTERDDTVNYVMFKVGYQF